MYASRIEQAQNALVSQGIDFLFITGELDLFYYTGMHFTAGCLLVGKKQVHLYVDGRYYGHSRESLKGLEVLLWDRKGFSSLEGKISGKLGIDPMLLNTQEYLDLLKLSGIEVVTLSPYFVEALRIQKDMNELEKIKISCDVTQEGLKHVMNYITEGVTEKELANRLELFWMKEYDAKPAFAPIVAFGKNTAYPHYRPSDVPLAKGDIILFDIGAIVDNYCSDMTRVFFFGDPGNKLKEVYQAVLEAQIRSVEASKVGKTCGDIDAVARKCLKESGLDKEFTHSLGHGIGLNIHESPYLKPGADQVLAERMVYSVEPGVYIPGTGGVRIEDTIVLFTEGPFNFTSFSKDPYLLN